MSESSYSGRRRLWATRTTRERIGSRPLVAATIGVPALSGIASLIAAGSPTPVSVVVAIAVAIVGFLAFLGAMYAYSWIVAPGEMARADAEAHGHTAEALRSLRESLKPQFQLTPSSVNEIRGLNPALAMLTVECLGNAQARNCRGRLVGLGRGRFQHSIDIPLAWAQPDDPADPSRKTFYGSARLNVARGGQNPNYMLPAFAQPLDLIDHQSAQLARDAENLLCVEITADDTPPLREWFRLRWWSFIILRDKKTGHDVLYDLHDDNIVFVPESESTRKPGLGDDEYS